MQDQNWDLQYWIESALLKTMKINPLFCLGDESKKMKFADLWNKIDENW